MSGTLSSEKKEKRIFVGNLHSEIKRTEIEGLFEDCGDITDLQMVRSKKGKFRGFCYISFDTEEGKKLAIQKNGEMFMDQVLKIDGDSRRTHSSLSRTNK